MNQKGLDFAMSHNTASLSSTSTKAEEKMSLANSLKLEGNDYYNKKNFKEAIRHYHRLFKQFFLTTLCPYLYMFFDLKSLTLC